MELEHFIISVPEFDSLSAARKIDIFLYYHTIIKGNEGANAKDIDYYFSSLKISKYSNVAQYLRQGTAKGKGKLSKFVLEKTFYHLERSMKAELDNLIKVQKIVPPSNNYFPLELFENTRGYLKTIAIQAASCYDQGLFDACSVMTRKLLEILIIEAFEKHNISEKVRNDKGNFYYLTDLIDIFKSEATWNIGRNAKSSLPSLKKMGDLSAHNRRYIARKPDIDKSKDDLRIVLEEMIHLIDYPNWNSTQPARSGVHA